ncbi:CHAP domain-containing protein [Nocardioides litoris]|uniref:CHAP domain-containing protein n=1 Tax=Nocardioides litoris TaxID=1926648 RepID=UPI001476D5A2|nr:CHAP domain-containing protein [Nocardioides litoris]
MPVLAASALVAVPAGAPPSQATSRYLCTGYAACAKAGYSHAGYASRNQTMYWRMYAGHNCTNYVAYRMIQAGMSTARPWSGSGMAYNWGFARKDITDSTPAVGAVAWWNRNVTGAGSSGHVAYVEKVVSPTEIVISEDSWSGDFHWRTIYKNGPGWPSGFIHFIDKPATPVLKATIGATVTGVPQVGVPLTAGLATFSPAAGAHALQWMADGVPIAGATGLTYVPTAATLGKAISVRNTASRPGYTSASATSPATAKVVAGVQQRGTKPAVSGVPVVGQVLTVVPGTWTPTPEERVFRWRADGVWLEGRNGTSFTVTADLVGKKISVVEVAKRAGYTKLSNNSADTAPVDAGVVALTTDFAPAGTARSGSTLTYAPGAWTPTDARAALQWFRDGVPVPGAVGPSYALGAADVGRRVTVQASVTKPRFRGVVRSADFGVVTAPSTVQLRGYGRKRGALARVRVVAPGVAAPTGTVWARIRGKVVRGAVVNGAAELRLRGLKPGKRTLIVVYAGNGVAESGRATVPVVVKR